MLAGIIQTTRFYKSAIFCFLLYIISQSLLYSSGGLLFLLYSYAFNDWIDAEKDAVGHPDRAIPSGKITPRQSIYVFTSLLLAGIGWSILLVSDYTFGFASIYVLSTLYSLFFKPYVPLLATVLWCSSISILVLQTVSQDLNDYIAVVLLMYSYEAILDYRDKDADKQFCKTPTIANLFGKYTLVISFILFGIGILILVRQLL